MTCDVGQATRCTATLPGGSNSTGRDPGISIGRPIQIPSRPRRESTAEPWRASTMMPNRRRSLARTTLRARRSLPELRRGPVRLATAMRWQPRPSTPEPWRPVPPRAQLRPLPGRRSSRLDQTAPRRRTARSFAAPSPPGASTIHRQARAEPTSEPPRAGPGSACCRVRNSPRPASRPRDRGAMHSRRTCRNARHPRPGNPSIRECVVPDRVDW